MHYNPSNPAAFDIEKLPSSSMPAACIGIVVLVVILTVIGLIAILGWLIQAL